jgi:hypothetical protein
MVFRRLSLAAGVALVLSACGGIIDPAKNTIETFSGTLQVGGTNTFNYSLGKTGEVEVTLTSTTPSPPSPIWVELGQISSGTCFQLGAGYVAQGIVNRKVQFGVLNKGSYCLLVVDPGVLTVPVAFVGSFSHP